MWKLNNTHLNKQWVTEEIKRKILVPWDKNENTLYQNLVVLFSHAVISDSVTPWTAARQPSLSITSSQSLLKLKSVESVMLSNHLILCCPLLLPPSVFPSIRVFSNESTLCIRWPKYWSFSFSISPSHEHPDWSPLEWTGWISVQSKGLSRVLSNTTDQKHQFFGTQPSLRSNSHIHTWLLEKL